MTPIPSPQPVLIVGAGPTGLTAALELSRLGIPVRLVDKAAGPSTTSRALAVQSRTLELLAQRGLAEPLVAAGNPAHRATIYADNKELGGVDLRRIPSRYNFILLLAQSETEGFLREALAQHQVEPEWGTTFTGFEARPGGGIRADLTRTDGPAETYEAAYLISAEGSHSVARHALNLSFEGKTLGQHYALGDLHLDGDVPEDELSIFTATDGFAALFPMRGGRFRLMVTDPGHDKTDAPPTLAELQAILDHLIPNRAKLRDMVWSSRYGINSRMMHTLRVDDVFFGGDAAHIHSPAGGQGMNTGIQDMLNLAWKLALVLRGQARPALLDTYEPERLQLIAKLLATTEKSTDLFNSTNPLVHWLLKILLPPVLGLSFVQQQSTAILSETANEYDHSALNGPGSPVGTLAAGQRLPDTNLRVQAAGGPAGRLYELLSPACFTVLVVNGLPLPTGLASWPDLIHGLTLTPLTAADHAEFAQLFGEQPAFVLVRPDAYVASSGGAGEVAAMERWLTDWLIPRP